MYASVHLYCHGANDDLLISFFFLTLYPFHAFSVQVLCFGFCVPCFSRLVVVLMGPKNCQHVVVIFSCFKVKREMNGLD